MRNQSRSDKIVCYGDSQTAGFSWGIRINDLSDYIHTMVGRGVSGQASGTIGIRQGGIKLTLDHSISITGVTPVEVATTASVTPCNNRATTIEGFFGGVRGIFDITEPNSSTGKPAGTFTPTTAPSTTVEVSAGSLFEVPDVLENPEWAECTHIIWMGGNDRAFHGTDAAPGTVASAKAQVDRLKTVVTNPRFLVAGPTVYASEVEGISGHNRAIETRDALMAEFPNNFVNIWEHVRDNGLDIIGLEPTEDDLAALAGKSMPPSLTSDNIHYSTQTRELVVAPFLLNELESRSWLQEGVPVVTTPLNKSTGDTIDEASYDLIDANFDVVTEALGNKAESDTVSDLQGDLAGKADQSALDAKLDANGPKTIEGPTTFNSAVAFNYNPRFGAAAVAADVAASDLTPMYIRVNTTSGAKSFTLPTGVLGGRRYVVGRSAQGSQPLSIVPPTNGSINGSSDPLVLTDQLEHVEIISLGAGGAWHVVSWNRGEASRPVVGNGTAAMLEAGTDTVVRGFSAKDIHDEIARQIAVQAQP